MGGGVAVDAFIPVVPGGADTKGNSLALNGELSVGSGTADMYTSHGGGVANPALPTPMGATTAPAFDPHIDGGIAIYDAPWAIELSSGQLVVGAYWHDRFGIEHGPGNLELSPADAAWLFRFSDPPLPDGWHSVSESPQDQKPLVVNVRK